MNITHYDRPHYIPCILVLEDFKPEEIEALMAVIGPTFQPQRLGYVSDHAFPIFNDLQKRGKPSWKLPVTFERDDALFLFSQCIKRFNVFGSLRLTPSASRLKLDITHPNDLVDIVDSLCGQQDNISLSQMWDTGRIKTQVYWTTRDCFINERLSRHVIKVNRTTSKKATEERNEKLVKEITETLHRNKVIEAERGFVPMKQYR